MLGGKALKRAIGVIATALIFSISSQCLLLPSIDNGFGVLADDVDETVPTDVVADENTDSNLDATITMETTAETQTVIPDQTSVETQQAQAESVPETSETTAVSETTVAAPVSSTGTLTVTSTISGAIVPSGVVNYVVLTSGGVFYDLHGNVVSTPADAVQQIGINRTGGSITYDGLDTSKTYVVTQTNSSGVALSATNEPAYINGFTWSAGGSTIVATASAFDATTHTATATIVNKYDSTNPSAATGSIKIVNVIGSGDHPSGIDGSSFGLYLRGSDGNYYNAAGQSTGTTATAIYLPANGTVVINNLPANITYSVSENKTDGTDHTANRRFYRLKVSGEQSGIVPSVIGEPSVVTLVNTYTLIRGAITVNVTVTDGGAGVSGSTFGFYLRGSDNNYYNAQGQSTGATATIITVSQAAPVTIENLPSNITYTISENTLPGENRTAYVVGYDLTGTQKIEGATVSEVEGFPAEYTLNNVYSLHLSDYGTLTINPVITGDYTETNNESFTYYVYSVTNGVREYYDDCGVPSSDPQPIVVTKSGNTYVDNTVLCLRRNLTYYVEEVASSAARRYYDVAVSYDAQPVSFGNSETVSTKVYNAYTVKLGSITVNASVVDGGSHAAGATFGFYLQDANGNYYNAQGVNTGSTATVILVSAANPVTINNLPVNRLYSINENKLPGEDHTAYRDYFKLTGTQSLSGVRPSLNNVPTSVTLVNKYTVIRGAITVNVTVTGGGSGAAGSDYGFYLKGSDGNYYNAQGQSTGVTATIITLSQAAPVTIENLPSNITYTISENTRPGTNRTAYLDGYDLSGTQEIQNVKVSTVNGFPADYTLRNVYTHRVTTATTGDFTVTKTVQGSRVTGPFTFTVTNEAGEYLNDLDLASFQSDVYTFKINAGESIEFDNIPIGTVLTIRDTNADRFGVMTTNSVVTVTITIKAEMTYVELVNAYVTPFPDENPPVTPVPSEETVPSDSEPTGTTDATVQTDSTVPSDTVATQPSTTQPTQAAQATETTQAAAPASNSSSNGSSTSNNAAPVQQTSVANSVLGADRGTTTTSAAPVEASEDAVTESSESGVSATGENDIRPIVVILILASIGMFITARKLREENTEK